VRKNEPTGEVRAALCQPCLALGLGLHLLSAKKYLFGAGGERNDRWTHGQIRTYVHPRRYSIIWQRTYVIFIQGGQQRLTTHAADTRKA
jgi:hypothetical protein